MTETLQALHQQHHGILTPLGDKQLPLGYGDFPGEVAAIERGLGVLVLEPAEVILVRGADAAKFLHGLTTNDIEGLQPGRAAHHLLCTTKGKIVHHVIAVRLREDNLAVICEPGEAGGVANHLEHYHIREEAELGRVELVRVDLLGPGAVGALESLGLAPGSVEGKFHDAPVLTPLLPVGALQRVVTLSPPSTAPGLVQALLDGVAPGATGGADAPRLVGWEAYDEARIWAGVPRFGADYGKEFFPGEATLYDHISFEKGCYVGQETHARMHYRGHPNRKLVAIDVPDIQFAEPVAPAPAAQAELFHEGKAVGTITSLARESREGLRRGIALLRYELVKEPGVEFATTPDAPPQISWRPLATDLGDRKSGGK